MLKAYIVYYRCKNAGDKRPGPVRQYPVYANSLEEARRVVARQANYPQINVLAVKPA